MVGKGYVELHCHSYFSLLDGASPPEALVERAATLGYGALALTDHNGLYGAVRFWQAARERGLKAIIGAEVCLTLDRPGHFAAGLSSLALEKGEGHLTLLAESQRGYANLSRLLSAAQLAGQKAQPRLTLASLAEHAAGLICLSGCSLGEIPRALQAGDEERALKVAGQMRDIFGPARFWIEVQRHCLPTGARLVAELEQLARRVGVDIVATNNVHYADRPGQRLHDVLTCIRQHATLPEALAAGLLHPNSERYLRSPAGMVAQFNAMPRALTNTLRIAEQCNVCLDFSEQRLPAFPVPGSHTLESYLRTLCEAGMRVKFDPITSRARAQLDHELAVIGRARLAGYFLVVWDIVRYARERGIRCQGRGSAANSLVAYVLDITPVDPLRHNLLFERFLSGGSHTTPDIDVDFAADRREEVIQYVYERYGEDHVGMVCNVVTYRARSAVREVAKALAFPQDVIDWTAKSLDTRSTVAAADSIADVVAEAITEIKAPDSEFPVSQSLPWHHLSELLRQMDGVPRHLSIHVGGMLITAAPLVEVVPLERATMPDRVVVQWDKDSVEDAGLIKIDLLSLRTLGAVEEALGHIKARRGLALDLERLSLDDPVVYEMLQRADTVGCFQVESRAQAQMQPKMQPACFEDIVIEIALIRPGPIQGGMVHPYLRRRQGLEPVTYIHPALEPALAETMGVIVFQEQVIRVAMAVAGFAPAEADQLRRAMSRSRSGAAMEALRARFVTGAQALGAEEEIAEEIFRQLAGFAGFGFCKSHAAAFGLVAYQTLYLKAHYAAEFYCALLNHQPMGFYPPSVLIGAARRHEVPVLRPDINHSREACTLEGEATSSSIRLGLRYVHGLGEAGQERIVQCREEEAHAREGAFRNLRDFCRRTRLSRQVVENLIRSGALDSLELARRDLLWELGTLDYQTEGLGLEMPVEKTVLPVLKRAEQFSWEHELLGLTPGSHVMDLYRAELQARGVLSSGQLAGKRDGEVVQLAGFAVVRQRPPTAKGFLFITLEDEEGLANLIVRPKVFEQYKDPLRNAPLLWVRGKVQREGGAMSILVYRAAPLVR